jgi:hypothetical protein
MPQQVHQLVGTKLDSAPLGRGWETPLGHDRTAGSNNGKLVSLDF